MIVTIRDAWRDPAWRMELAVTAAILVPVLFALTHFLDWNESRRGVTMPDPVLALFPAVNLTWLTFLVIYAGIIVGLAVLLQNPRRLLLVFQALGQVGALGRKVRLRRTEDRALDLVLELHQHVDGSIPAEVTWETTAPRALRLLPAVR